MMLLRPTDVKIKKIEGKENTSVFTFEPLPKGFGHTLGNTLRRILMTSMPGTAVTQIKVEGAVHQFDTVAGVKEDLVEIGLNFKQVRAKIHGDNPVVGKIEVKGPGKITAGDIQITSDVEILNKKQHIATLADAKSTFEVEVVFEPGVGYSPVEERETSKIGVIMLDALFSPIIGANYTVEQTRKGTEADLDKLVMEIETDGAIEASDALTEASTLLRNFFTRFARAEDPEEEEVEEKADEVIAPTLDAKKVSVEELPLPTRTVNALKKAEIETLSELAEKSDDDLADIKNLGDKSVQEIKKLLEKEGLR